MDTMTKEELYRRQLGIVDMGELNSSSCTIIGAGSIGSFTALSLAKMGVADITVYDPDIVSFHNLPSQFFKKSQLGKPKVKALADIVSEFTGVHIKPIERFYVAQEIESDVVIAAPDKISVREMAFKGALRDKKRFIDARMGAELGMFYTIDTADDEQVKFYEATLFDDEEAEPLPCTARTIIYTVQIAAAFICRAYKAHIMKESYPKEIIFNLTRLDKTSLMLE